MTSETLARAETLGRLLVLEARVELSGTEGTRRDGVSVSMVLTSTLHWRCTPRTNRSIPTIPAGRTDAGPSNVSAVDTRPRKSEFGFLGGTARRLRHRSANTTPLPAACAGTRSPWFNATPAPSPSPLRVQPTCTRAGLSLVKRGACRTVPRQADQPLSQMS